MATSKGKKKRIKAACQDLQEQVFGEDANAGKAKAGAMSGGAILAPWRAWNSGRIEAVTMDLTEATRRFPRAYGSARFYPEVV